MRTFIIITLSCCFCAFISAQNITSAEYFFDANDNGFGNNNALTVNQPNENYSIPTGSLSNGFHSLYIRVFDQAANEGVGAWSHYDRSTFYLMAYPPEQNIVAARYWIDNGSVVILTVDPVSTSVTETYSIPTGSLPEGFHSLHIQTQNAAGIWSLYDRSFFYVSAFDEVQNIVAARYFFNDDAPTNLTIETAAPSLSQSYSIETTGLEEGFHSFYVQTQGADLTWSLYDRQIIYIKEFDSEVVSAEYYIDNDLGIGNNIPFSITASPQTISFNTTGLSEGDHLFCVRVLNEDNSWSFSDCEVFTIGTLGVEDSLYKSVKVIPNPFINSINLDVSRSVVFQNITIFDMTGKEVFKSSDDLRQLDLGYLESGIYILSLATENEKATFKIVKQ